MVSIELLADLNHNGEVVEEGTRIDDGRLQSHRLSEKEVNHLVEIGAAKVVQTATPAQIADKPEGSEGDATGVPSGTDQGSAHTDTPPPSDPANGQQTTAGLPPMAPPANPGL